MRGANTEKTNGDKQIKFKTTVHLSKLAYGTMTHWIKLRKALP